MRPELKKRIQIVLVLAILVAAVRTGWILYQRHSERAAQTSQKPAAPGLNPDYYVVPKKLYAYDLKSAREGLTKGPAWVKEGYRYVCYPYNSASRHADFSHEAGLLLPLQKLDIKDVVLDRSPEKGQRQVMAVFEKEGRAYAFPIGLESGGDFKIYPDEILFIQDPRELYKHWPADVWEAIERHEVKPGMNELQADFAIGMGVPERSDNPDVKTVKYPNGGKPLTVIYRDGRAAEIRAGDAA
jgi:hypothetical protein